MSVSYSYINCKGWGTPRKSPFGNGVVRVRDAALNVWSEFGCDWRTEINLTGGAHCGFDIHMGAHNYVIPPDQLNKRYNKPEDEYKRFSVNVSGNICTDASWVGSSQDYSGTFMHDASRLNLRLLGAWSMSRARLWGNLGFDLEAVNEIPLNDWMGFQHEELGKWVEVGYPAKVPEVILSDVKPDYSLWQLMRCSGVDKKVIKNVYCNTLKAAQQVLKSGCTINQFCAFKDAHDHPNCRCALYYPLLLELNHLALAYFMKAGAHTRQYVREPFTSLSRALVEDTLNTVILERNVRITHTEYGDEIYEAPVEAKAVQRVTWERFDKFLKDAGIEKTSLLWRAP